jgi:hypothetical protein
MKIWRQTEEFSEGKFLVVRRDGSVPHWPHFVIGARDPFAGAALRAYADAAEKGGADPEFVASVREEAERYAAYRALQGDGDPDAPPHRVDNVDVINAMRHLPALIHVRPDKGNTPNTKE